MKKLKLFLIMLFVFVQITGGVLAANWNDVPTQSGGGSSVSASSSPRRWFCNILWANKNQIYFDVERFGW